MDNWFLFLFLRLPMALALFAAVAEITAFILRDAPEVRHPLDRLLVSMQSSPNNAEVVLLGDSVTQDAASQYALGSETQITNLTTNQASGMTGALLLLKRHLARSTTPPQHVAIAATPEFFAYTPRGATKDVYLLSVFRRADEQDYMAEAGIVTDGNSWKPAILEPERRIFNRAVGLVHGLLPKPRTPLAQPPQDVPLETRGGNMASTSMIEQRSVKRIELSETARRAMKSICALSKTQAFTVHIVWAPAPESAHRLWLEHETLRSLERTLRKSTGDCRNIRFSDSNLLRSFPDHAFRDPDHLRRPGWTIAYSNLLRNMLAEMIASPTTDKPR